MKKNMKAARYYIRWFIIGVGNIMGISHSLPADEDRSNATDAIGRDFRAVGDDLRKVMKQYPARSETSRKLQSAQQLELAGIK
jgi:hypothetical protein